LFNKLIQLLKLYEPLKFFILNKSLGIVNNFPIVEFKKVLNTYFSIYKLKLNMVN